MQVVVFEKIYKCLLDQTARKVMLLLINNALEKTPQKGKTEEILKVLNAICNLHLCYRYKKNALAFSQSDMHNFQNPFTLLHSGKVIVPNKS